MGDALIGQRLPQATTCLGNTSAAIWIVAVPAPESKAPPASSIHKLRPRPQRFKGRWNTRARRALILTKHTS
jgi:hypothetical protein